MPPGGGCRLRGRPQRFVFVEGARAAGAYRARLSQDEREAEPARIGAIVRRLLGKGIGVRPVDDVRHIRHVNCGTRGGNAALGNGGLGGGHHHPEQARGWRDGRARPQTGNRSGQRAVGRGSLRHALELWRLKEALRSMPRAEEPPPGEAPTPSVAPTAFQEIFLPSWLRITCLRLRFERPKSCL